MFDIYSGIIRNTLRVFCGVGTILDVFTSCLPVMYIGLVVIGQNYQKHLKRNQSTFFLVSMIKCFGLKNSTN